MTVIELSTEINALPERCFDLARDVDLHKLSTGKTKERAIAGRTTGLCKKGDTIIWEAVHFGIKQKLTVEITEMNRPHYFADHMLKGAFKYMQHRHHFEAQDAGTLMKDYFEYEVPFGILGKLFDKIILKKYMTRFLKERNTFLKAAAEA